MIPLVFVHHHKIKTLWLTIVIGRQQLLILLVWSFYNIYHVNTPLQFRENKADIDVLLVELHPSSTLTLVSINAIPSSSSFS